jgi:Lectin C-type domain
MYIIMMQIHLVFMCVCVQATWEQNFHKCCSMGLKPIVFETQMELECLGNYTKSVKIFVLGLFLKNAIWSDGWKYNFNYWTGGTQRSCKGQWSWCAGAESITFLDNLKWAFNQPDNRAGGDDCVHMRFLQNTTGLVLADKNCSDKYIVACEVSKISHI